MKCVLVVVGDVEVGLMEVMVMVDGGWMVSERDAEWTWTR